MSDGPHTSGTAGSPPDDLSRRVAELEQQLAKVSAERDKYRAWCMDMADELFPPDPNWQPPAPEDTVDAWDLLAELKQKYGVGGQ